MKHIQIFEEHNNIDTEYLEKVVNSYLEAALWAENLDDKYSINDISTESILSSRYDVINFLKKAKTLVDDLEPDQIGHDFWLTRNGHGAGFWDRDLGETGDKLTEICKEIGNVWIYVGDDGKIYIN